MPVPVFTSGEVLTAANMNTVGLWRITSCTVTSVGGSAATASNGVITTGIGNTLVTISNAFSNSFRNYKVIMTYGSTSAGGRLNLQLSGSTGTNYETAVTYVTFGTATNQVISTPAQTSFYIAETNANGFAASFDLHNPFVSTTKTFVEGQWMSAVLGGRLTGVQSTNVSHTGFNISPASGNINSNIEIRVYGYRD